MSAIKSNRIDHVTQLLFISIFFLSCFSLLYTSQARAESKPQSMKGQMMHDKTKLAPCPSSPNCVNSQVSGDKKHFIKALQLKETSLDTNRDKLLEVLNTLPRVKVVVIDDNYIKAEFKSKLFSFVDDVEFVIAESHIDVRSASRTGYSDLGANRKRIEKIRSKLKNKKAN